MAYEGSVELISGIKQANNGSFPLVDASAVRITDNKRLSDIDLNASGLYRFMFNIPANNGTSPVVVGFGPMAWTGEPVFTENARVASYEVPQSKHYTNLTYTINERSVSGQVTILPGAPSGTIEFLVAETKA